MAKGLASGMPLSGLAARPDHMAGWRTGAHGGTFGGNVVSCAAAVATIYGMRVQKLIENSAAMGRGLLLLTSGPWENTVRWIPPLIINESHIQEAVDKFERALQARR
jgi:4-aminobutyrate aminotransferase